VLGTADIDCDDRLRATGVLLALSLLMGQARYDSHEVWCLPNPRLVILISESLPLAASGRWSSHCVRVRRIGDVEVEKYW
jgi:hypothetical protein